MANSVFRVFVFVSLLVIGLTIPAHSQCLVVTPTGSGSGTGADWNNAIHGANLAAVVARNNVYYLAGGSYNFANGSQNFSTPDNGTQTITIRAATAADHGVGAGCGQTGFTAGMAASGSNQVVFKCSTCLSGSFAAHMGFFTDHWVLDGNETRKTVSDSSSAYNMKVDNSWNGTSTSGDLGIDIRLGAVGSGPTDITIQYMEFAGTGLDAYNVDTAPISSISCVGGTTANVTLGAQRENNYAFVGQWVMIGGTTNYDTAFTLSDSHSQQQFNIMNPGCSWSGGTATCTLQSAPVAHIGGDVVIAGNSVSGYNGTFPITGVNYTNKTLSYTISDPGSTGTGGTASCNNSIGVQISSVTDPTHFSVSGNRYTCSGATETIGILAGPVVQGENAVYMVGDGQTPGSGPSNVAVLYSFYHDGIGAWELGETTNVSIKYSACERLSSHPINFHAQCLADSGSDGLTYAYNRDLDFEGTGDMGALYRNHTQTSSNWKIFGNVFGLTNGNPYARINAGNGEVFCINTGITCSNWYILNNTVVGSGTPFDTHWGWVLNQAAADHIVIKNNLAYNTMQNNGTWFNSLNSGIGSSEDYNTYLNLGSSAPTLDQHDFAINSAPDPFVNSAGYNYLLSSETVAPHLNDGISTYALLPANTIDPTGATRGADGTWDRGAFEFNGTAARPNPPQNLGASVH
jgi:hypothetical protein